MFKILAALYLWTVLPLFVWITVVKLFNLENTDV